MPWPRTGSFGLVDNPLEFSPFVENNAPGSGGGPPAFNDFLLLNGGNFLLLNGNDLTLLGAE